MINNKALVLYLLGLLALAVPAQASELPLGASALTHNHDGKIQGCGIRVTGGRVALKAPSVWVDLSFNVYTSGVALVQAFGYDILPSQYDAQTWPERLWVQRAWIRPRGARALTRLGENTEAREGLVYAITLAEAALLFEAVAAEKPVAIAIRGWGETREQVIEGVVQLGDDARGEVEACLAALVNSIDP